jgi:hypothetical protein
LELKNTRKSHGVGCVETCEFPRLYVGVPTRFSPVLAIAVVLSVLRVDLKRLIAAAKSSLAEKKNGSEKRREKKYTVLVCVQTCVPSRLYIGVSTRIRLFLRAQSFSKPTGWFFKEWAHLLCFLRMLPSWAGLIRRFCCRPHVDF